MTEGKAKMTRLEAKDFLIGLGIDEPTDEQISSYLNKFNGEIQKEKVKVEQYKKDSERVVELQKQLDELNNANLSDIDKANKEAEKAKNQIAELERKINEMNTKNSLLANGIKDEEAEKIIASLNSGTFDATILGEIIADRTKTAVADFEKKALEGTPNPNGNGATGNGGSDAETKTDADKLAEDYAKSLGETNKASADIVNAYM